MQKKFGKKLKIARVEQDMTQTQLAVAVDAKQKSISSYETGLALPSINTLEKLARVLKKPISHFFEEN